ncbi:MAG: ribosomal RNA small subunit methyltransferase A [Candidatus Yanofskybacteria bacterium]|nr:ribosomal RNA small subunit methyltransferase A [Candidatus Yanofskybacteria bacterium]
MIKLIITNNPQMSLVTEIKNELNQLGLKPKKSLGQNFLINEGIYKKIIDIAEIKPSETIVEIGPGLGTLTEYIAGSNARLLGIEKDENLAIYLKKKFENRINIKILQEDILKFDPVKNGLETRGYKLLGNIPYYLTSHLIRLVLGEWPLPKLMVLMVQKEVAQRIIAKPPNTNLLAVSIQYYARVEIAGMVSKGSFWPQPEVDSAIIKLTPKTEIPEAEETERFFKVSKAGFSGTRKQLINTLSGGLKLSRGIVSSKLLSLGIATQRRAETLTLDEWQNIATSLLPR